MREEAVKAYRIPVEAPIDLLEAYFEVREKALREVLDHVAYSKTEKIHLNFKADDRRKLRSILLRD